MRGRPSHPGEQSWEQIFGSDPAPARQAPAPQHPSASQQAFEQFPQFPTPLRQDASPLQPQAREGSLPLGMRSPEQPVLRLRRHGRRLVLPALVLIAATAAFGFNLGALQEPSIGIRHAWLLIAFAGGILLGIVPMVVWLQARYRLTTHRIVISTGAFTSETREILMNAIVDITVRRNLWQAMFGSGTIVLTTISGQRVRLIDVPAANAVAASIRELSGP